MRIFGLIGYPLSHSFSKKYFSEKFATEGITDAVYELFELPDIASFPQILAQNPALRGLNVTIPHKLNIIPFLDRVDAAAAKIGAVNVVKILENGQKVGYNSDYFGFQTSLRNWFLEIHGTTGDAKLKTVQALILGSGGASKAVKTALDDMGIHNQLVSRQAENGLTYEQITPDTIAAYQLIINTTPLGMSPKVEGYPAFPYEWVGRGHHFYDLVYNPTETAFMRLGKEKGAHTLNGLPMLYAQAEKSWEIWNEK
jgi:shikimate dehydrogenase